MAQIDNRIIKTVTMRVIPLLFLANLMSWFDRVNVGIAALKMNQDLGFTPEVYGFGAGVFFWGYALFEIPSNYIMTRIGGPKWLGRIVITIGVLACAMAFVRNATSFYIVRFLLGLGEAGLFPGMAYYIALWFPSENRARALAPVFWASIVALITIGPLSGALLGVELFGLHGWQWMFLVEGVPAIVVGLVIIRFLSPVPGQASFLSAADRTDLQRSIAASNAGTTAVKQTTFAASLVSGTVWFYVLVYFCFSSGQYSLFFWSPQVIKAGFPEFSAFQVAMISAIPLVLGGIGMLIAGSSSDRTGDRRWHLVIFGIVAGVALIIGAYANSPIVSFLSLCVAVFCSNSYLVIYWPAMLSQMRGGALAGAPALINAIGSLGGFTGPYLVGYFRGATGSFATGIASFAVFLILAGLFPAIFARFFPPVSRGLEMPEAAVAE